MSYLLDEEATCRSCDEALVAYQRMKINLKTYHERLRDIPREAATYHERLRVYMETCLKNCRVPTWDEWLEVLLNTNQEEQ